jgi:hypothetical protein
MQSNNLSLRLELMTFIGLVEGTKGYIFMRSPNNIIFTTIQALFDKTLFLKCLNMHRPGYTSVGLPPDDLQGEHNRPLDDKNGDYGGGLPNVPVQFLLHGQPQQLQPKQPCMVQPPVQPPLLPSDNKEDLEDMYRTPPQVTSPQNPSWEEPTPCPSRLVRRPKRLPPLWTGNKLKHDAWDWYYCHHPYLSDSRLKPAGDDSRSMRDASSSDDAGTYSRELLGSPFRMPLPLPPQEGLSDLQPRQSERERRPTLCPGNLCGSRPSTSTEQMST